MRTSVAARDGIELSVTRNHSHYRESVGTLLLIHSIGLSAPAWRRFVEFVPDFDVISVDCRGHGLSTRARGPYDLDLFADDVADVVDALEVPQVLAIGASMGGVVAQAFALRHPDRVSGLGLVDTTAWYGPDAAEKWEVRAARAVSEGLHTSLDFQLDRWFTEAFREQHPEVASEIVGLFLDTSPESFAAACRMMGAFDLRERLHEIAVPTAVLVGDEDYATPPEMSLQLHDAIIGSTFSVLPQTRHLSFIEAPQLVAGALRADLFPRVSSA